MTQNQVIAIIVAVLAVLAVAVFYLRTQKSRRLFANASGPEYERAVSEAGGARAEARLERIEKRVRKYDIHPLDAAARERYLEQWRVVQARFVDDPNGTVSEADRLLGEVMAARGYPVADFEQQAADPFGQSRSCNRAYRQDMPCLGMPTARRAPRIFARP